MFSRFNSKCSLFAENTKKEVALRLNCHLGTNAAADADAALDNNVVKEEEEEVGNLINFKTSWALLKLFGNTAPGSGLEQDKGKRGDDDGAEVYWL